MSITAPSEEEPSDTTATDVIGPERGDVPTDHLDLPRDVQLVGVDGHGHTHLHSPRHNWVVVVTPDGDVPYEQELGTDSVHNWIAHTEQCRGEWDDLRYCEGGAFENIAETIVDATERDT